MPPDEGSSRLADVAVVAIGRNEGERLRRCLDSLPPAIRAVVYVDSGSTDGSVAAARGRGAEVVELDGTVPFTAARARNAGLRRVRERWPGIPLVQLLDGDCTLAPGWLEAAVGELSASPRAAVVCGRRREARPGASIYNRLCDMEWDTPVGEAESCGGDALARLAALAEVGDFDAGLIAGEEPELCARLRARGWGIRRIACEMTLHDAAMTRFGQWWRRAVRAGHAFAEVHARHPSLWGRQVRSSLLWGAALPGAAVVAGSLTGGVGLALLAAYPVLWWRILLRRRARGDSLPDAVLYAAFCIVSKGAELAGAARFHRNRARGTRSGLIEYK